MATAGTPTSTLLVLATFLGMGLGPMLAARWLHRRSVGSLFGPTTPLLRHFAIAMAICAGAYGLTALLPSSVEPQTNLAPTLWASFLPLALVGVLVQTGAEEVLFRGYIQQQLAAMNFSPLTLLILPPAGIAALHYVNPEIMGSLGIYMVIAVSILAALLRMKLRKRVNVRQASPMVWMVLPSAVFAVLHYQPDLMGENAWLVVGAVFLFALLAADLTAKTGNIGAAWGFHFANNCVAILFLAMDGPLSGLALYTVPMADLSAVDLRPLLFMDMTVTLLVWGAIRLAVSRR